MCNHPGLPVKNPKIFNCHHVPSQATNNFCSISSASCPTAVIDSGASDNYIRPTDEYVTSQVTHQDGPSVKFPDASNSKSTKSAVLPLSSQLSTIAKTGHILPNLKTSTLLSTGKLCDDECAVVFRKEKVHVIKDSPKVETLLSSTSTLLQGDRNPLNKLWTTPLHPNPKNTITLSSKLLPGHPALYS